MVVLSQGSGVSKMKWSKLTNAREPINGVKFNDQTIDDTLTSWYKDLLVAEAKVLDSGSGE